MCDYKIEKLYLEVLSGEEFVGLFPNLSARLVKLTDSMDMHNNFKYETGLNVDTEKFNPVSQNMPGGLYFIDENYISVFLSYNYSRWMKYCRRVELPADCKVYIEVGGKFKADKIILGERVEIKDLPCWSDENYCKLSINLCANACVHVNFLINELKIYALKKNPESLRVMLDRKIELDEDVQLFAVKMKGYNICHLFKHGIKVSHKVQKEAVTHEPFVLGEIFDNLSFEEISDDVINTAISLKGDTIKFLLERKIPVSETLKMRAICNGADIRNFLNNNVDISIPIQKAAIYHIGTVPGFTTIFEFILKHIKIVEEVQLFAIQERWEDETIEIIKSLIKYDIHISEKVMLEAVSREIETNKLFRLRSETEVVKYLLEKEIYVPDYILKIDEDHRTENLSKNNVATKC